MVTRGDVAMCSQVQACLPNHVGVLWSFTVHAGQQVKEVYILNIQPHGCILSYAK
jgi:hypothetical protein